MNVAILRGRLSSPPREQQLASGDMLVSLEVTTRGEDGQAASVPVAWFTRSSRTSRWESGVEVVVVGMVRRRFFRTGNGATASRTEVVAGTVTLASRTAAVAKVVVDTTAALGELANPGEPTTPPRPPARSARRGRSTDA